MFAMNEYHYNMLSWVEFAIILLCIFLICRLHFAQAYLLRYVNSKDNLKHAQIYKERILKVVQIYLDTQ